MTISPIVFVNSFMPRRISGLNDGRKAWTALYVDIHVIHLPFHMPILTITAAAELTNPAPKQTDPIDIPGLLDIAVKEYATWHQPRVSSETFRENIQKARDLALENCLGLKQIHEDQDPDFFCQ